MVLLISDLEREKLRVELENPKIPLCPPPNVIEPRFKKAIMNILSPSLPFPREKPKISPNKTKKKSKNIIKKQQF